MEISIFNYRKDLLKMIMNRILIMKMILIDNKIPQIVILMMMINKMLDRISLLFLLRIIKIEKYQK